MVRRSTYIIIGSLIVLLVTASCSKTKEPEPERIGEVQQEFGWEPDGTVVCTATSDCVAQGIFPPNFTCQYNDPIGICVGPVCSSSIECQPSDGIDTVCMSLGYPYNTKRCVLSNHTECDDNKAGDKKCFQQDSMSQCYHAAERCVSSNHNTCFGTDLAPGYSNSTAYEYQHTNNASQWQLNCLASSPQQHCCATPKTSDSDDTYIWCDDSACVYTFPGPRGTVTGTLVDNFE